jgi:hypothetical protein
VDARVSATEPVTAARTIFTLFDAAVAGHRETIPNRPYQEPARSPSGSGECWERIATGMGGQQLG